MQENNSLSVTIRVKKSEIVSLSDKQSGESSVELAMRMVDEIEWICPNARIHVEVEV